MAAKAYYPLFLDIANKTAVIVGGGRVALRKATGLLEAGAQVIVIAPSFDAGFETVGVERIAREFNDSDVAGAALVFAATNRREVNAAVTAAARSRGIPVNVADAGTEGDFITPARIRRGDVQIAISTSGTNPAEAARIRAAMEAFLDSLLGN